MINKINELKKISLGPDMIGIAPASRFDEDDPIFKILPETKSVICLVYRVLRGTHRGIEEGTAYHHFTTMAIEVLDETVMPMMARSALTGVGVARQMATIRCTTWFRMVPVTISGRGRRSSATSIPIRRVRP